MKKWFFLLISLPFFFGACKKDKAAGCTATESTQVATAAEIDSLQRYLTNNSITAQQHESGVFYTINTSGTGLQPGVCNSIAVTYSAYLLGNPVAFQSFLDSAGIAFAVQDLIVGWQRVMPVLKEGGSMTIYIPPSMGYGAVDKKNPNGDIIVPKNSYLKFDVNLIDVY